MIKFLLYVLLLILVPVVLSALGYFWIKAIRKWKKEDNETAVKELKDSTELFQSYVPNYTKDYDKV